MSDVNYAQAIRSVALTCDFLRVRREPEGFINFQFKNLAWLENITGARTTWPTWGIMTSIITVPTQPNEFRRAVGNDALFSSYLDNADQTWASLYDSDELQGFSETMEKLLDHDLIVGFELPPVLKRTLQKAGKKYISLYIHPVRFLRDLCFLVTTNSDDIGNLLAKDEVSSEEITYQSRRFKALFSRVCPPALAVPDGVPILIGQTERDSVLIKDGKFTTWEDHEEALAETLASYPDVIFLEHPYRKDSTLITEYLRGRHVKNVISIRGNSYGVVFSQVQSPFFLTLSSSLGVEARSAGHKCFFLSADPSEKFILKGIDVPNAAMVSHSILKNEFWRTVFSNLPEKKKIKRSASANFFALGENFLRNSLESWAFRNLQFGTGADPVLKQLLPATSATDEHVAAISDALCARDPAAVSELLAKQHTQQAWGIVQILSKPFSQDTSLKIDFSAPSTAYYFIEGFHSPEEWGVWSSSNYAKLALPIDLRGDSEVQVDISMVVKVFSGILPYAPVLHITMADNEVGVVLFRQTAKNDQQIHITSRIKSSVCQVEFHISHTASPAMVSQSADHRDLSFGIYAMNVSVSSPNSEKNKEFEIEMPAKIWGLSAGAGATENQKI